MILSPSAARTLRTRLRALARQYLREVGSMTYRALRTRQNPPWASVAFGAAGIAAALAGRRRAGAGDLTIAERWLSAASRGSREREAFWSPESGGARRRCSLYYSSDGLDLVRVLVAHARRDEGSFDRALTRFLGRCRESSRASFVSRSGHRGAPGELLHGAAGYLSSLVVLHRRTGEPRVREVADELAGDLLQRARGPRGWVQAECLGFGHGRAGVFHALLGWSQVTRTELPSSFFDELAVLATDVERRGTMGAPPGASPVLQRSWCNGAAGLLLLWARAHEHTSDALFLRLARGAARACSTHQNRAHGDLCCGLGGRAYALLAMDRIEPERGWYDRSLVMAASAVESMLAGCGGWPNGLLKGYPGLVCLVDSLSGAGRGRSGFPLVEA